MKSTKRSFYKSTSFFATQLTAPISPIKYIIPTPLPIVWIPINISYCSGK